MPKITETLNFGWGSGSSYMVIHAEPPAREENESKWEIPTNFYMSCSLMKALERFHYGMFAAYYSVGFVPKKPNDATTKAIWAVAFVEVWQILIALAAWLCLDRLLGNAPHGSDWYMLGFMAVVWVIDAYTYLVGMRGVKYGDRMRKLPKPIRLRFLMFYYTLYFGGIVGAIITIVTVGLHH